MNHEEKQRMENAEERLYRIEAKVEGNSHKIEENSHKIEENTRKIEENGRKIEENGRRIEVNGRKIEENGRRIEENGRKIDVLASNQAFIIKKMDEYAERGQRHLEVLSEQHRHEMQLIRELFVGQNERLDDLNRRVTVLEEAG